MKTKRTDNIIKPQQIAANYPTPNPFITLKKVSKIKGGNTNLTLKLALLLVFSKTERRANVVIQQQITEN